MPTQNEEELLNRVLRKTPLETVKHNVEEEHFTLVEKMSKLYKFIYGTMYSSLPVYHQNMLSEQLEHMEGYARTLRDRILDLDKQIRKEKRCTKDKS